MGDNITSLDEDDIIIIDNGDTFEGNLSQFRDCFFSNPTLANIQDWCRSHHMTLEIRKNKS